MIDSNEKHKPQLAFTLQNSCVFEKCSKCKLRPIVNYIMSDVQPSKMPRCGFTQLSDVQKCTQRFMPFDSRPEHKQFCQT